MFRWAVYFAFFFFFRYNLNEKRIDWYASITNHWKLQSFGIEYFPCDVEGLFVYVLIDSMTIEDLKGSKVLAKNIFFCEIIHSEL
jgi:hypothetical protein